MFSCFQGHTGDTPASILIPACVDAVKGHKSPLTGGPVYVIGAGAVYDGRGLAANLAWGAQAVWVGTRYDILHSSSCLTYASLINVCFGYRFVAAEEAAAPKIHKDLIVSAGFGDAIRTLIYTGRPLRVRKTDYVADW